MYVPLYQPDNSTNRSMIALLLMILFAAATLTIRASSQSSLVDNEQIAGIVPDTPTPLLFVFYTDN